MSPVSQRRHAVVATRTMARRRRRRRAIVAIGLTAGLLVGTGYGAWRYIEENEYLLDERCEVTVGESEHRLSPAQTHHAALIAASAVDRGLPVEAAADVIGFSLQESDLLPRQGGNDEEDRRVLFARGSPERATAASDTIGGVLSDLEDSWDEAEDSDNDEDDSPEHWEPTLSLEEAAEVLDRPHNHSFYEGHQNLAQAFATPLTGQQPVGMRCELSQLEAAAPDAQGLAEEFADFADSALGIAFTEPGDDDDEDEFTPEPIFDDVIEISGSGPEAILVITPDESEEQYNLTWMVAHWSVAAAEDYGVQEVQAGAYTWERDSGRWMREEGPAESGAVTVSFSR